MTQQFLHVGCGQKRKDQTTKGFNTSNWTEIRFDIDEQVKPDLIGTMTDMESVQSGTMDALYSSHNIEHLFPHEVPVALKEFQRVLKDDGFLIITCPDLQEACRLVAEDKLLEPAYNSPAGQITPLDILYGWRGSTAKGNHYMAHKCGFTEKVLRAVLTESGFARAATTRRKHPYYDLWAVATKANISDEALTALAKEHFPS